MASKHMHEAAQSSIFKAEGRHGHSGGKSDKENNEWRAKQQKESRVRRDFHWFHSVLMASVSKQR